MGWSLQDLINQVYTETKRPDLVSDTQSAVIASVIKMHGLEFFYKDVQPTLLVFDSPAYIQTIDTQTIPRFRAMNYIRKWDPSLAAYQQNPYLLPPLTNNSLGIPVNPQLALAFLEYCPANWILDNYGAEKVDIWYAAGSTVFIKSSTLLTQGLLGFYQYPNIDNANNYANFYSWIADQFPYAIIYDAASKILQSIGMDSAARKYDNTNPNNPGLVQDHIHNLIMSNITPEGR